MNVSTPPPAATASAVANAGPGLMSAQRAAAGSVASGPRPSPPMGARRLHHHHPYGAGSGSGSGAGNGSTGRGGSGAFGPPTLQSDTVVFQAAKIPLSSARRAAVAPGAPPGVAPAGSRPSAYHREHDSSYAGAPIRPRQRPPTTTTTCRPYESPSNQQDSHQRDEGHEPELGRQRSGPYAQPSPSHRRAVSLDIPSRSRGGHYDRRGSEQLSEGASPRVDGPTAPPALPSPREGRPRSASPGQRRTPTNQSHPTTPKRSIRLTIRVHKEGDKLGFGIRNDPNRQLKVSTLQSNSTAAKSSLQIGDTLLSVNGIDLTNLGFLEVIQQLKATKPGELVFDVERDLDPSPESATTGTASASGVGDDGRPEECMDLDSPLSVAEKRFGGSQRRPNSATAPTATVTAEGAGDADDDPAPRGPPRGNDNTSRVPTPPPLPPRQPQPQILPAHQESPQAPQPPRQYPTPPASATQPVRDHEKQAAPASSAAEPARKRPRPAGLTAAQVEMEMSRLDKQHRVVLNALSLELKKEKTERMNVEEKNAALRKRLQNMLIECDDVRVKANTAVTSIKERSRREIEELKQALQAARAQMRLQDRGPDVGRTDSIINDLMIARSQLERFKKTEMERSAAMSSRFSYESRLAEREVERVRERLIVMFQNQLRDVARRHYHNGRRLEVAGKEGMEVVVALEGLRRMAFAKFVRLPSSFEWYTSEEYTSTKAQRRVLQHQEEVLDMFGDNLYHEERAGLFVAVAAPMEIIYDPAQERVTLVCSWREQNQIRELARNFRF